MNLQFNLLNGNKCAEFKLRSKGEAIPVAGCGDT
jgi:hypothetical protein